MSSDALKVRMNNLENKIRGDLSDVKRKQDVTHEVVINTDTLQLDIIEAIQNDTSTINDAIGDSTAILNAINSKITFGSDDTLNDAFQSAVYARKDMTPSGLRALKCADDGTLHTFDTGLNMKITRGNEFTLSEAQQVLVYGEVTSGPGTGELHPIHITNGGDVEVEIADFKKGQEAMADSFPVVLASDQSTVSVSDVNITTGENDTLETAAQFLMYGRKDSAPTGLSAVKVSTDGSLHVSTARNAFVKDNEIVNVPASGTGSSTPVNTLAQDGFGICATSTNQNDPIELYASNNNSDYYQTNIVSQGGQFYHEIYHPCFNYYFIQQTDTSGNPHFMDVICSKR